MSDVSILVENISKRYQIGAARDRNRTLREDIMSALTNPLRFFRSHVHGVGDQAPDYIWALENISLEVKHGEVLGIIGPNGAGKSTLLKILSRITEPTQGRAFLYGRVGSLLEVGTGFHSELTGAENIYLSGTILGMNSSEISRKFDEIVAFAEVEKFINTPVKYYSSGMYMRLAFAVAAHLPHEILLIDEVLAVGDADFQKKCLGKMGEVSTQGRTLFFVSHNMSSIRSLCSRAILLDNGKIKYAGNTSDTVAAYERSVYSDGHGVWENPDDSEMEVKLSKIVIMDKRNSIKSHFLNTELIRIALYTECNEPANNVKVGFSLIKDGAVAFMTHHTDKLKKHTFLQGEKYLFTCEIPRFLLNVGQYHLIPMISIHCVKFLTVHKNPVLNIRIDLDPTVSEFHNVLTERNNPGSVFPIFEWKNPSQLD